MTDYIIKTKEATKIAISGGYESWFSKASSSGSAKTEADKIAATAEEFSSILNGLTSAYSTLNDTVEKYNKSQGLTINTLSTILQLNPEYIACLKLENGQMSINRDILKEVAAQKLEDAKASYVRKTMEDMATKAAGDAARTAGQSGKTYKTASNALSKYSKDIAGWAKSAGLTSDEINAIAKNLKYAKQNGADMNAVVGGIIETVGKGIGLFDELGDDPLAAIEDGLDSATDSAKDFSSALSSIKSAYDTLTSSVDAYARKGALNISQLSSLLSLDPEYLSLLDLQNGRMSLNYDATMKLAKAKIEESRATYMQTMMEKLATDVRAKSAVEAAKATGEYGLATQALAQYSKVLADLAISSELPVATIENLTDALRNGSANIEGVTAVVRDYAENMQKADRLFDDLSDSSWNMFNDTAASASNASSGLSALKTAYDNLTETAKTYNDNGYITLSQLDAILSMDYQYLAMLDDEAGQMGINEAATRALVEQRLQQARADAINSAITQINTLATNANSKAHNANATILGAETIAWQNLSDAMNMAYQSGASMDDINAVMDGLYKALSAIDKFAAGGMNALMGNTKESFDWGKLLDAELAAMDDAMERGRVDFNDYLNRRRILIEKYYEDGKIEADKYYDYLQKHYQQQISLMDRTISYVTDRLDEEIDKYNKQIEDLTESYDKIEKHYQGIIDECGDSIERMDAVIRFANDTIDDEIDRQNDLMDDLEKRYQEQIDALDEEAKAYEKQKKELQDINDEIDRQRALAEALYNLDRARNQKTRRVYDREEGFVYRNDPEKVRDAQDQVRKARLDIEIAKIDEALEKITSRQDVLREELEKAKESIQEVIDKLNEYKDAWGEISGAYQKEQDKLIALEEIGANAEQIILNRRMDVVQKFTTKYKDAMQRQADATKALDDAKKRFEAEKASIEEVIKSLEDYKNKWGEISSEYEKQQNDLIASQVLGQDKEQKILEQRMDVLNDFKDTYIAAQRAMTDAVSGAVEEQLRIQREALEKMNAMRDAFKVDTSGSYGNQTGTPDTGAVQDTASDSNYPYKGMSLIPVVPADPLDYKKKASLIRYDVIWVDKARAAGIPESTILAARNAIASVTDDAQMSNVATTTGYSSISASEFYSELRGNGLRFHTGLDKGPVGSPMSNADAVKQLQKTGKKGLMPDERMAVLKIGEVVMTQDQMLNIAKALRAPMISANVPRITLPSPAAMGATGAGNVNITQNVTVTLPNINNEGGFENLGRYLSGLQDQARQRTSNKVSMRMMANG